MKKFYFENFILKIDRFQKTYKFYNAKLADFGLAKEYDNDDSIRNHSKAFIKVTVAQIALDFDSRAGFWFHIGTESHGQPCRKAILNQSQRVLCFLGH